MDNVEEMDKFLEKYNFPKLDHNIRSFVHSRTLTDAYYVPEKLLENKAVADSASWSPGWGGRHINQSYK